MFFAHSLPPLTQNVLERREGWRDRQLPDGTVVWTSPTGREPPLAVDTAGERGVMMPKRRHTRAHTTAKAIATERRLNESYAAAEHELMQPDETWSAPAPRSNDPPPF